MERDLELIREIIEAVAKWSDRQARRVEIDGFDRVLVDHHVDLCVAKGLLKAIDVTCLADQSPQYLVISITFEGYDFLDMARSKEVWRRAKDTVAAIGGGTSFEVFKAVLAEVGKSAAMNVLQGKAAF